MVERATLAPFGDVNAYVLQRGEGHTWPTAVKRREALLIPDTKFTNGVVFFDGEKKQGTYLAGSDANCLDGCLAGWMLWFGGWLLAWMVVGGFGWLVSWLVGWLIG